MTKTRRHKLVWMLILVASPALAWQPQIHPNRRQAIQTILAGCVAAPRTVSAAAVDEFVPYSVAPFSFEIPKSWKVTVKPSPGKPKDGKVFSALDSETGAVLTVVQEQICSRTDYALNEKKCDLVGGDGSGSSVFAEATFDQDVTKLLRRYNDRDNVVIEGYPYSVIQGTTALDRVERDALPGSFQAFITSSIPTGGTYLGKDAREQPYATTRTVQSRVRVVDNDRVMSVWLSAPTDEWRKPLVGTQLLQVWGSIQ